MEVIYMNSTVLQTYSNHERAEYAHEVAMYKRSLDLYSHLEKEMTREKQPSKKDISIRFAESKGGSYGGLAGAAVAVVLSYGQMALKTGGTIDSLLISALFGLFIGSAVGGLDNAFRSYQTAKRGMLGSN